MTNQPAIPFPSESKERQGIITTLSSVLLRRAQLANKGKMFDGDRDFYKIFGYNSDPQPDDYHWKFRRQGIAGRICMAFPDETWDFPPKFKEDGDNTKESAWEKKMRVYFKRHQLWSYLWRADVLANLGRYSILWLGIDDGKAHSQPFSGKKGKLRFVRVHGEDTATIKEWDTDKSSPRYGLPKVYEIKVTKPLPVDNTETLSYENIEVHASRVIHVAETLLDSEIYGIPRMERVYNDLDDLMKVGGGAAEVFWANARGGLNLNVDKEASIAPEVLDDLQNEAEDYLHQLNRLIRTQGVDLKPIEMSVASPRDQFDILMDLIATATGIPKRILMGSERGQLASEQDDRNWITRVNARRTKFNEPRMLMPLTEKLMDMGEIPRRDIGDYEFEWPPGGQPTEAQAAEVATKKANAIMAYAQSPGSEFVVPPRQFVEVIMGLPFQGEEDAFKILKAEQGLPTEGNSPPSSGGSSDNPTSAENQLQLGI